MPSIGQVLVEARLITEDQLREAQGQGGSNIAQTLIQKGWVGEEQYVSAVARAFGLEKARLQDAEPDPELTALLPEDTARNLGAIPLRKEGAMLHVAIVDPSNDRTVDRIGRATGLSVKLQVAGPAAIQAGIQRFYGGGGGVATATAPPARATKRAAPKEEGPSIQDLDQTLKHAVQEIAPSDSAGSEATRELERLAINNLDPPVVRTVNALLLKALKMGASDIHVEPLEYDLRIRYRIDGVLVEALRVGAEMRSGITSRLKIMCDMDIAEKRIPQDGGIKVALNEKDVVDFRVSSLPTIYGEKMVLRILGTSELRDSIDDLGFEGRNLELVREAIQNPYGMILVTGPTGSGKTTTLYTILKQLNDPDVNIVTAEDPVEYRLAGITQVNIRHNVGLTFDAALRSFLRQDPDIILVGEMRDFETSAIAVKAALTGHLVLSTLHTNDCPSTVVRMVDMGIEPYLVASACKLVIAQRLIRRICTNCKVDVDLAELERTNLDQATLASIEYIARGKGCDKCNGMGYKGRIPVFEVMPVKSKDLRRAITEGGTEVQVAQIAKREGMQTLSECAVDLVNKGVTSLEEAMGIILAD